MALHWTCSSVSISLSYRRTQNWTQHSRCASQARRRGEGPLPSTCSKSSAHKTTRCLCHKRILLPHALLDVHLDPCVLLSKAAFQPLSPSLYWLFPSRCSTWHFPLFRRILSAHFSSLRRPLSMALQPSGQSNFSQFCTIYQLAESALCPSTQAISEDAEQHQPHHPPLVHTVRDQPSTGPHTSDHSPLSLAPHCPLTQAAVYQFVNEDDKGDSVKCFTETKTNSIHYPRILPPHL